MGYEKLILGVQCKPGLTGATGPGGGGLAGPTGAAGSNATLSCALGGTCALGDSGPGGGKVFYIQKGLTTRFFPTIRPIALLDVVCTF